MTDHPWMNDRIKSLIKNKEAIFQKQKSQIYTVEHTILSDITIE